MKKLALIVIAICTAVIVLVIRNPKAEAVVVVTTSPTVSVVSTEMATATATKVQTATAAIEPLYPPRGNRWIADAYKTHFYQGDCYSHGSEHSQGLTDFCQGKTLKIWSVWPGWYVAYEGKDGKSFKIPLSQGENTIQFPADAWMIRIGR